jgi:hypothetical protein
MRVYLEVSSLNRPFDDQTQMRIRMESEAILEVFRQIDNGSSPPTPCILPQPKSDAWECS